MASETFNVLITGTKTGIGHGLLSLYASRPNTIVIAAIRNNPSSEEAKAMVSSVTLASNSKVVPVQYDAASVTAAQALIDDLKHSNPEIKHLDLIIAGAAPPSYWGPTYSAPAEDAIAQYNTIAMGPLTLYQAARPLLLATPSHRTPRFILISSLVGSVTIGPNTPAMAVGYGMAKAAGNFWIRKANAEEDRIVLLPVDPGSVKTRMGNWSAAKLGLKEATTSVEESVSGIVGILEGVDKEKSLKSGLLRAGGDEKGSPW